MKLSSIDNLTRAEAIREYRHSMKLAADYEARYRAAETSGERLRADRLLTMIDVFESRAAKLKYRYFL